MRKVTTALLAVLAAALCGCSAPRFVPVGQGAESRLVRLSHIDPVLRCLFDSHDPGRHMLLWTGPPLPPDVAAVVGDVDATYDSANRRIYRNASRQIPTAGLLDLMRHEFAHYVWLELMDDRARRDWRRHLSENPPPWQTGLSRLISRQDPHYASEEFAFAVQLMRPVDLAALVDAGVLSCDKYALSVRE